MQLSVKQRHTLSHMIFSSPGGVISWNEVISEPPLHTQVRRYLQACANSHFNSASSSPYHSTEPSPNPIVRNYPRHMDAPWISPVPHFHMATSLSGEFSSEEVAEPSPMPRLPSSLLHNTSRLSHGDTSPLSGRSATPIPSGEVVVVEEGLSKLRLHCSPALTSGVFSSASSS